MTEAQAAILRRVRWDSQARESDFHVAEVTRCLVSGWLWHDAHRCLSLTPAGLAALAEHERKGEKE